MRLGSYLRSCAPGIAVGVASIVFLYIALGAVSVTGAAALLITSIPVLSALIVLIVDYTRKQAFYRDLHACSQHPDQALWLTEMVERPYFVEGCIAYDDLEVITRAANNRISAAERRVGEYREYIETWVHEAKSPLSAAHLAVENLRDTLMPIDGSAPDVEEVLRGTDAVEESLDRTEGYIEQALFYARSETVDRDYLVRSYTLHDLVVKTVKDNFRLLIGAHMEPRLANLSEKVFTDEKWIRFILGQLIQNSVKYARAEGAEITFSSYVQDQGRSSERVVLVVADNGRGVGAADLPRVFDRGFTGEQGRVTERATGIGLYLVKRLCTKMGIGVEARSALGEGFEMRLAFPTNRFRYVDEDDSSQRSRMHGSYRVDPSSSM
ncbi:sensor histidine kinase [Collinsella sp. AGMB00827]|uniref:Sensor-like histidine kinase SenX3 n=1 Tax=Collinsella ureilytica TaxID=2869515 RepID=A0ABS7MJT7_9ACTN|nr:sensor histidine kinase [Collinsella urealyticum]MBY4797527.1 sensor histidine kinase [Collinsella urealyticum]